MIEILKYIDFEWQTKKTILNKMKENGIVLDERTFRLYIEKINNEYINHSSDVFIVHSSKGYKYALSEEEIIESITENYKRALNLLSKESKIKKALEENRNLKFGW